MSHPRARFVGNQAVRAYLAEIGGLYFRSLYDHKEGPGKKAWAEAMEFFGNACVYCGTKESNLPRNTTMTLEHLVETNQFEVGLHHPGNTVPACKPCNNSRHPIANGQSTSWQDHLASRCKGLNEKTKNKRRQRIEEYIARGPNPYPQLTKKQIAFLKTACKSLYQEAMSLSNSRVELYQLIANLSPADSSPKKISTSP